MLTVRALHTGILSCKLALSCLYLFIRFYSLLPSNCKRTKPSEPRLFFDRRSNGQES